MDFGSAAQKLGWIHGDDGWARRSQAPGWFGLELAGFRSWEAAPSSMLHFAALSSSVFSVHAFLCYLQTPAHDGSLFRHYFPLTLCPLPSSIFFQLGSVGWTVNGNGHSEGMGSGYEAVCALMIYQSNYLRTPFYFVIPPFQTTAVVLNAHDVVRGVCEVLGMRRR